MCCHSDVQWTDPNAGTNGVDLGNIVVASESKVTGHQIQTHCRVGANQRRISILADQDVLSEIAQGVGRRMALQIALVGKQPHGKIGNFAGHQVVLRWAKQSDCDVGIALMWVCYLVVHVHLDFDLRMICHEFGDDPRKKQCAEYLVG